MEDIVTHAKPKSILQTIIRDRPGLFAPLKPGDVVEGTVIRKGSRLILVDLGRHGTGAIYGGEIMNARETARGLGPGAKISGKVVSLDNEDGYVELSITEAGRQKSWERVTELRDKDEVIKVTPSGYNKGGLVANLDGIAAFLPLSQLSTEHYPKVDNGDTAKIMQALQKLMTEEFQVKVIDINQKQDKVIISERAALEENMKALAARYNPGDVVHGVITGVAGFGAFMKFSDTPELEGLIHVSEIDHRLVTNPKEAVTIGEAVKAKVLEVSNGRVYLSLKALKENPWAASLETYKRGDEVEGVVQAITPVGALITLGDLQGQVHVTEFGSVDEMKKQLEVGRSYKFTVGEIKPEEKRIFLKPRKQS